jgi:hypothetical protein
LCFVNNDANGVLSAGDTDVTEYAWDYRNRLCRATTIFPVGRQLEIPDSDVS